MNLSRRNLLKSSAVIPALGMLGSLNPIAEAVAGELRQASIKDIIAMNPIQSCEDSEAVKASMKVLRDIAKTIKDSKIRAVVLEVLDNPTPTIVTNDNVAVTKALKAKGYIATDRETAYPAYVSAQKAAQPFWSAPGSGYGSHHAYPGGLATHTALNALSAQDLLRNYRSVFNSQLNYDIAIAAELLHDLHKPWVFQWKADNSSRKELACAGTGEHHILSIAESMKRGLDPRLVVAQACAHDHPGTPKSEESVVRWIDAASIYAGIDPIKGGYLAQDGKTLPQPRAMEGFVVHLADHDFVLSGPACRWSVEALRTLAKEQYGITDEKSFNAFRNYVLAHLTAMRLYAILSNQGKEAFAKDVARVVRR